MKKETKKEDVSGHGVKALILMFLLISGSCGLIYEILWMKILTLVIGNTVFSITTVVTAFMGGLALGSFLAGRLYGVNTFGAVLGSFLAGFVLIPSLGITWTIDLAALLNLSICAGIFKLAKNRVPWEPSGSKRKSKDKKRQKERAEDVVPEGWGPIQWVVMVEIGISGIAAMIYQ